MKILITGATGFIGSHLLENLVAKNLDIMCMVRKTSDTSRLNDLGVEARIGDLGDPSSLKSVPKNVDLVYHLAAYYTFLGKKNLYKKFNEKGTQYLLNSCESAGVSRFIYCSSTEAIGAVPIASSDNIDDYAKEDSPYNPQLEYGKSKMRTEKLVMEHKGELDWTILRPSGVYGPRCLDDISYWWVEAIAKHKLSMWFRIRNSGTVHFTHVSDIIQGFDLAMNEKAKNEIFFISSDECQHVDTAIEEISKILNKNKPRFAFPKILAKGAIAPIQLFNRIRGKPNFFLQLAAVDSITQGRNYSNQKAKDYLGYMPKFDIKTGMEDTIQWYKDNGFL
jgi:nucleoside-diphosphate-sugar epimerase